MDYTKERKAFGKSILDNQYVHYRLAELETEIECLKALTYRAGGVCYEQFIACILDVVCSVETFFIFMVYSCCDIINSVAVFSHCT